MSKVSTKPAFVQQILPGVVGGIASAMCLYPLEVFETLLQGAAAESSKARSVSSYTRRRRCVIVSSESSQCPAPIGVIEANFRNVKTPSSLQMAQATWTRGALLHGADMALLSAIFGYTVFFGMLELTAPLGNASVVLFARNLGAACISFFVNTPFQLLKTTTVLSDGVPAVTLARKITNDFTQIDRLWHGTLANSLGVLFLAAQFTLYALMSAALPGAGHSSAAAIGMLATALSAAITYPVLSVRTAVMAQRDGADGRGDGDRCLKRIVKAARNMARNGTLYNGVVTNIVRTTLPSGILFGVQSLLTG